MLPKPCQRQLLRSPKELIGFVWAVCGFWHLLALVWGSVVGVFCCSGFPGVSAGRLIELNPRAEVNLITEVYINLSDKCAVHLSAFLLDSNELFFLWTVICFKYSKHPHSP